MAGSLLFSQWRVFTDTYEPYREWIMCGDRRDLDIRHGDRVLEVAPSARGAPGVKEEHWDGCRFQVRRGDANGKVVRDLDEWQVRQLHGGELPTWPPEGLALNRIQTALLEVMPHGKKAFAAVAEAMAKFIEYMAPDVQDPPKEEEHAPGPLSLAKAVGNRTCFVADVDIPGTAIRAGDVVAEIPFGGATRVEDVPVRVITVPRECYPAVWPRVARWTPHGEFYSYRGQDPHTQLAETLRKSYGHRQRAKPQTAPLVILRPLRSPIREPIAARSDEGAIFELLCEIGCAMPKGGDDA
jgi:hypothetical protein